MSLRDDSFYQWGLRPEDFKYQSFRCEHFISRLRGILVSLKFLTSSLIFKAYLFKRICTTKYTLDTIQEDRPVAIIYLSRTCCLHTSRTPWPWGWAHQTWGQTRGCLCLLPSLPCPGLLINLVRWSTIHNQYVMSLLKKHPSFGVFNQYE